MLTADSLESTADTETRRRELTAEARRVARRLRRIARQREASIEPQVFNLAQYMGQVISAVRCAP